MALIGKEWNVESWNGSMWEDPDEVGGIEPQNSEEASLLAEEASPLPVGAASPPLRGVTLHCL